MSVHRTKDHHSSVVHKERQPKTHPMTLLMQKIAAKNEIGFTLLDGGRIVRLEKNGSVKFVQNYIVPVNSSSSAVVCKDKAACSDVLKKERVPQIRHRLFLNPTLGDWTPIKGSWPGIHAYGEKHKYNVVCKPKDGGGGHGIRHTTNPRELEKAVAEIFKTSRDLVLCAFKAFKHEYRVLIFNDQPELILRKILPNVVGDGKQTIAELIGSYLSKMEPSHKPKLIKLIPPDLLFSKEIPESGKEIPLHWMHNGPGALTEILGGAAYYDEFNLTNKDFDDPRRRTLVEIALKTVKAIGIRFASVDIVEIPEDPKGKVYRVLEVNSASMLDHKLDMNPQLSERLELRIYTKIVNDLFGSSKKETKESFQLSKIQIPPPPSEQKTHQLAKILAQIASANGWKSSAHSQGWITHLSEKDKVRLVYGYTFPLNNSTSAKVCGNKPATSAVLRHANIPQIRHHRIALSDPEQSGTKSAWLAASAFASKHHYDIVCKPTEGTGGNGVEHVKTVQELESVASKLLKNNGEMAVCSFQKIRFEYRLIMLNGEAEVVFRKVPPFVVGDGVQSIQKLAAKLLGEMEPKRRDKILENMNREILISDTIPAVNERVYLHWKHNLGQGAYCELLGGKSYFEVNEKSEEISPDLKKMVEIAKLTVKALDVLFVSVDIVEIENASLVPKDNNGLNTEKEFRVMEVNSGVMMDNLMEQHGELGVRLATTIYTKALALSFNGE